MTTTALTTTNPTTNPLVLVDSAQLAESTKKKYKSALGAYLQTGAGMMDTAALVNFAGTLSNSRRSHLKSAVKIYAAQLTRLTRANVNIYDPAEVSQAQGAIMRFEALTESIHVKSAKGEKIHIWLTAAEVKRMIDAVPSDTLVGKRDRLVLGLLVGAGLRRNECIGVRCADVMPMSDTRMAINILKGKGDKSRVVPISERLHEIIVEWCTEIAGQGCLARSISKNGDIGESFSGVGVFNMVRKYGKLIGRPNLAPHDLRRTYAKIAHKNGISIEQIQILLGHSNLKTTMRYLNIDIDDKVTASDFVPL